MIKKIYLLTKSSPNDERFGQTQQIRRAVCSITNNLAEGSARISNVEIARFTEIAFGSLMEVLNQLLTAQDLAYISEQQVQKMRPLIEEISNKLNRLRKSQLARK